MIAFAVEPHFDFSSSAYAGLYAECGLSAFQDPVWLASFYRRLPAAAGFDPMVVTGRDADGDLALVLPLLRSTGSSHAPLEFAFLGVSDYACPVVRPAILADDSEMGALRAFLKEAAGGAGLRVEPVREQDRGIWERSVGGEFEPLSYGSHAIALGETPYRREPSGPRPEPVRNLARKARRLSERGKARFEILGPERAGQAIFEAADLRRGRFPDDPLQARAFTGFYADVACLGAASGYAITYRLSVDDETVAILFGVVWRRTYCYLLLACNYGRFAGYSPGFLVFDRVLADWSARGGTIFDFTIGDEPYKGRFGCTRTPMLRATLQP